jgi:tetratricopeptide (TPR) repeat protein
MRFSLLFILLFSPMVYPQTQVDSLKRVLQASKVDTVRANLYNKLAARYRDISPDSSAANAHKAMKLARQSRYEVAVGNAYINLGNSELLQGRYDSALKHFTNAEQTFSKLSDNKSNIWHQSGLARSHASLGVIYSEKSNYYLALEHYQKALKIYREIGQSTSESKALNNIAVVYKSQEKYDKALEYLKEALKLQVQNGESTVSVTLTNIGNCYFQTGDYPNALQYYQRAQTEFNRTPNVRGEALLDTYLGDLHLKQGNRELAESYYRHALEKNESIGHKFGSALALYNLGQLYYESNQYREAFPLAQKSLAYAREMGVLDQAYHSEKLLSDLYSATGNPAKSLEHYKAYVAARDSILHREQARKFAMTEMNFEYQKKEALLAEKSKRQNQLTLFVVLGTLLLIGLILITYNRMQVKRRLTLQKEVAEYEHKALHLQMNPHFVFNCLSSISSFIVQNGTDQALKYLSKFSKLMRLTLEYSKGALIPIDKEVESLQNYLELEQLRFHDKFDFKIIQTDAVEFNVGLPPLLIQPFVENAILHGMVPKEGRGMITVTFDAKDGQLICLIEDDGIGIAGSYKLKENSVAAHQSMALEITKKRLQIMESTTSKSAQIEITDLHRGQQTGTRVTLKLPIQYIQ